MAPTLVLPPPCPLLNMTAFLIPNSSRKHTTTFILPMFWGFWPLSHTRVYVYQPLVHTFCTTMHNMLYFQQRGGSIWPERHLTVRGERQTLTEWCQAAVFPIVYTTSLSFVTKQEESLTQAMWILFSASCYLRPIENHCPGKWHVMCLCNLVHPQVIVYPLKKIEHKLTTL